MTKYDADMQEI